MTLLRPTGSTRRWRQLRALVLDRDGHRCQLPIDASGQLCGAYATHVDHVLPRSKGGSDHPANLRAACQTCNLRRGDRQHDVDARRARPLGWSW